MWWEQQVLKGKVRSPGHAAPAPGDSEARMVCLHERQRGCCWVRQMASGGGLVQDPCHSHSPDSWHSHPGRLPETWSRN